MKCSSLLSPAPIAVGLCFTLLAGCANLEPQLEETRFYTLTSAADARSGQQPAGLTPALIRVSVSADYLEQPAIAVRKSAQEIEFREGHRWAERLDRNLARVIIRGIESRQPALSVAPASEASPGEAQVFITIALVACEGTAEGAAVLQANWRVSPKEDSTAARTGRYNGRRENWNGRDFGQLAAQLSLLADELAAEIAPVVAQAADIES